VGLQSIVADARGGDRNDDVGISLKMFGESPKQIEIVLQPQGAGVQKDELV